MVQYAPLETHPRWKLPALVQILVDRVAARVEGPGDGDFVADLQRANRGFGNRCGKIDHRERGVMDCWIDGWMD
jgi:hypothetical protein